MAKSNTNIVGLSGALLICSAIAVSMALPLTAWGEGEEILILSEDVVSEFNENITFKIKASGPDPIDEIRVFLKSLGSERSTYRYLDIARGEVADGEYVMNLRGTNYRPPGTIIRYSYEIRDVAGRVLRTDDREHLYLDESLEWESVSEGLLTVYYYGDFVEKRARTVLEASQMTLDNMGKLLGILPEEPIRIVSYSNYRDMSRGLPFRSQAVREELETQGQAWTDERVLLVLSSGPTVTGIASHEFTHILVAEAAGRFVAAVPAWLNEGLAEYGNVDPTPIYGRALAYAVYTRRLKPLWYLQSLGGEPDDILIGYGHGVSVVTYLIDRYGDGKIADVMAEIKQGDTVDEALQTVYGFDQFGLDSEWRLAIGLEPFDSREQGTPETAPVPEPRDDQAATPLPTARPQDTPASERPTAEPAASEPRRTTAGCNAPSPGAASVPIDLVMVALLAGPALGFGLRRPRLPDWLPRLLRLRRKLCEPRTDPGVRFTTSALLQL